MRNAVPKCFDAHCRAARATGCTALYRYPLLPLLPLLLLSLLLALLAVVYPFLRVDRVDDLTPERLLAPFPIAGVRLYTSRDRYDWGPRGEH